MAEENGKKARELISISVVPYPDWNGKTTSTDKRFGDGEHKFCVTLPVPQTDEESQELYGVDLVDIIEDGVIQGFYGARDVDNIISENFAKGRSYDKETKKWSIVNQSALVDPNSEDL
ncbi:MAG: hypothetical protein EHM49_09515, partial [Deltaproteobacteria bacterium]